MHILRSDKLLCTDNNKESNNTSNKNKHSVIIQKHNPMICQQNIQPRQIELCYIWLLKNKRQRKEITNSSPGLPKRKYIKINLDSTEERKTRSNHGKTLDSKNSRFHSLKFHQKKAEQRKLTAVCTSSSEYAPARIGVETRRAGKRADDPWR